MHAVELVFVVEFGKYFAVVVHVDVDVSGLYMLEIWMRERGKQMKIFM